MLTAARIVGIVGSVIGIAIALNMLVYSWDSWGGTFDVVRGFLGFLAFVGSLVGASISLNYPQRAYQLQGAGGIAGGVLTLPGGLIPLIMLVLGAVLAHRGQSEIPAEQHSPRS